MKAFLWAAALREKVRKFTRADAGNVTMIFAIATVPMVGLIGAAVDYSRANSVKVAMQAAADSTALMLSKDAATITSAQLQSKATSIFTALFTRPEATSLAVTASYTSSGSSQVLVSASSKIKADFMKVIGFNDLDVAVDSKVKWGTLRLRVALALDTTGSMADDGKMPALKVAAKDLITQLQSASTTNGDVYVSILPFSKNVNVGTANSGADWIDWTEWESEPEILKNNKPSNWERVGPGSNCPFSNNTHGFVCAPNPTSTSTSARIPSSGTFKGYICPATDSGRRDAQRIGLMYNGCYTSEEATRTVSTGAGASCTVGGVVLADCTCTGSGSSRECTQDYYEHTWVKNARSTWNGCVAERGLPSGPSGDYDRQVAAPSGSIRASLFPAEQNNACSPAVIPLNYNWNSMRTAVDALYPAGATNQPIGLVHAWQSLVGGAGHPAPPPKDTNYTYREAIVLMSDGLNTLNRWYGNGSTTEPQVDRRMRESASVGTCANIKAAGLTVYAVHVNTGGDPMSTLLQNCASSPDKFYHVTSASGLAGVFKQIGTELSQLRIAE